MALSLSLILSLYLCLCLSLVHSAHCRLFIAGLLFDWPVFFATLTADGGGSERTEVSGEIIALRQRADEGGAWRENRVQLSIFPINWPSLCDTSRCSSVNKLTTNF